MNTPMPLLTALLLMPLAVLHAADAPSTSPKAFNHIENPNRVTPQNTTLIFIKGAVNLPPHSVTIITVPLK